MDDRRVCREIVGPGVADRLLASIRFHLPGLAGESAGDLIAMARDSIEIIASADHDVASMCRAHDHAGRLSAIAAVLGAQCDEAMAEIMRESS